MERAWEGLQGRTCGLHQPGGQTQLSVRPRNSEGRDVPVHLNSLVLPVKH